MESEEEELTPLSTTQDQVLLSFSPGNAHRREASLLLFHL